MTIYEACMGERKKVAEVKAENPELYCSDFALYLFYIYEPTQFKIICQNLNPVRNDRSLLQALLFDETAAVSALSSNYGKIDKNVKINHQAIRDLYTAAKKTVENFKITKDRITTCCKLLF